MAGLGKNWKGMFGGKYLGNIWQTFNIDLERQQNRLILSDKMRRFVSGLGVVTKFIRTDATTTDQWFGIVNNADILRNGNGSIDSGTWITDDTSGTFNDPLDGVIHEIANGEQRLVVTRLTDVAILNSAAAPNVWTASWWQGVLGQPALTSSEFHPIARLQRLVALGDKVNGVPVIHTIDKDDVVSYSRLTFDPVYTVRCIYTSSNRFWFGLQHDREGKAKVIEWDGFSQTYNNEYELTGSFPITGFIADDIPTFITERGLVEEYTGGGFREVQNFHIDEDRTYFSASTVATSAITNYGCWVEGDIVFINLNAPTVFAFNATALNRGVRRLRAGIWIYNKRSRNLYHHMGLGEHASSGTDVNYGTSPFASVGAIVRCFNINGLVASAEVYVGGATWQAGTATGIYIQQPNTQQSSSAGKNRGYFITPYIAIEDIEAMWESIWIKFKRFVNSNNRINVKWRVVDPLFNASAADQVGSAFDIWGNINAPGTWVNTTSFTCKVPTGVSVGDEVEILTGDNAGCSFKISALSATPDNSTLITVTISETAPTSSTDTFLCRFDNWKTETAISDTTVGNKRIPFSTQGHGEFIQIKVELVGYDLQVDEIQPTWKSKTKSTQA